jgi:transposase InsO family protein
MIRQLSADYPIRLLCAVLAMARSTVYYEPVVNPEDAEVLAAIERVLMRWPFYGYRRVTAHLKREGWKVGETRVRRLLRQIDHSCSVGRMRVATTDSKHDLPRYPNLVKKLEVTRPNQVWVADITYIRLGRRFIYLAIILDACTRGLRGWHLSRSLEARDLTMMALKMASARHPAPDFHHSDQGSQYATPDYTDLLPETTRISMAAVGQPTENGLAERFIRTLKEEHLDYSDYRDFDDAFEQLAHWLEVEYMTERIHSALGYLTPAEFEAALIVQQLDSLLLQA